MLLHLSVFIYNSCYIRSAVNLACNGMNHTPNDILVYALLLPMFMCSQLLLSMFCACMYFQSLLCVVITGLSYMVLLCVSLLMKAASVS